MFRFSGRMEDCETVSMFCIMLQLNKMFCIIVVELQVFVVGLLIQIFIPMHYGDKTWSSVAGKKKGHWWLLIVHPHLLVAEIWDSAPGTINRMDSTRIVYKTVND